MLLPGLGRYRRLTSPRWNPDSRYRREHLQPPAPATILETGLTADCTGLDIDEEKRMLLMTRPTFGGNVMATIFCERHRPQMSTVRPKVFRLPERDPERKGNIHHHPFEPPAAGLPSIVDFIRDAGAGGRVDITRFPALIVAGKGACDAESMPMLSGSPISSVGRSPVPGRLSNRAFCPTSAKSARQGRLSPRSCMWRWEFRVPSSTSSACRAPSGSWRSTLTPMRPYSAWPMWASSGITRRSCPSS